MRGVYLGNILGMVRGCRGLYDFMMWFSMIVVH